MSEVWKDIPDFDGYQVSNLGRVRTFWRKKKARGRWGGTERVFEEYPHLIPQSDDGNGYMKVFLVRNDGKKFCKKVHRLVAEAFIPHFDDEDTVDHIRSGPEGKPDNSVSNLRWLSRSENIKKAYADGVCDERIASQNKPIISRDLWTNEERYFDSIKEASEKLGVERSSISHVLHGDIQRTSHYYFEFAGMEDRLLYGWDY